MGILREDIGAAGSAQGGAPSAASSAPQLPIGNASADARAHSELRRRRDALAEQVTELHWDLGGLAYEMAIRDHFRLDVLVRRAAMLQERDAELAEVERLLRMEEGGVAGDCPSCSAPHSRGALFCWQCGAMLMQRSTSEVIAESGGATTVMDALLAPHGLALAEPDARAGE